MQQVRCLFLSKFSFAFFISIFFFPFQMILNKECFCKNVSLCLEHNDIDSHVQLSIGLWYLLIFYSLHAQYELVHWRKAAHHVEPKVDFLEKMKINVIFFRDSSLSNKNKEALSTLVKSLVQMTCSDFTIFLNWLSLLYKTRFSAE